MIQKAKLMNRKSLIRLGVNLLSFLPLIILILRLVTGNLGFNPIQTATLLTGRAAIAFLILSLAITPLRKITGYQSLSVYRKSFGLLAFMYALIHFVIYIWFDYGLMWALIWRSITNSLFIILGLLAFALLLLLAVTSSLPLQKKLGKAWKKLHKLVYVAALAAVYHYALAGKRDLFRLQGDILFPILALVLVILLLVLRIPSVLNLFINNKEKSHTQ